MDTSMHPTDTFNASTMYSFILPFENSEDLVSREFMANNWHMAYYIGGVYLTSILVGKHLMKDRKPLEVRRMLVAWNILMAVFSAIGAYRTLPELIYVLRTHGMDHSICKNTFIFNKVYSFWATLFTLSKVLEMCDTAFVIAKKQQLYHLHWIHHVTTMCVTFAVFDDAPAMGRWMVIFNYSIHAIMYGYYALRCLKFNIPRKVALVITVSQIIQMIFGLIFVIYSYFRGGNCDISQKSLLLIFGMYFTFFALFLNFFVQAYLVKKKKKV